MTGRNVDDAFRTNPAMRKCDRCPKPATLHITELQGGAPTEIHLCEQCAKEYLSLEGVAPSAAPSDVEAEAEPDVTCPQCGLTFADFRRTGRLGCAQDYEVFDEFLIGLYESVHGANRHLGKAPQRSGEEVLRQQELIRLRRELREAVAREAYEKAASLRDEIHQLEIH